MINFNVAEEYALLKAGVTERKKDFDDFVGFLESETNWLTAPASIKYHMNKKGGLLEHCVRVTKTLLMLREFMAPQITAESCIITGLFHDAGKVGMPGSPRYLEAGGHFSYNSSQVEMQIANRSLYLVSKYIPLTDNEAQAILYHDGQYIPENKFIAHRECPLTLLLTFADTWSAAVYEEGRKIEDNNHYFKRK